MFDNVIVTFSNVFTNTLRLRHCHYVPNETDSLIQRASQPTPFSFIFLARPPHDSWSVFLLRILFGPSVYVLHEVRCETLCLNMEGRPLL